MLATRSLGESGGGKAHPLFILSTPHGKFGAVHLKRVSEARDVSVSENSVHAGKQRNVHTVHNGALSDEEAHKRFGGCESNGLNGHWYHL